VDGGIFVPPDFSTDVMRKAHNIPGMRSAARVRSTSRDQFTQPIMGAGAVTWVSENASVADQVIANSSLTIRVNKMRALVLISNDLLEDSAVNLLSILSEEFAEVIAEEEDNQFATGNAAGRPAGLFSNTDVQANLVKTGVAAALSDASNNGMDALISLQFTPKAKYRRNGKFGMNSNTEAAVRKLKDSYGQYLWQPSAQAGMPATLLGDPIVVIEGAPSVAANKFPIIYGDFNYYLIVDRVGMSVKILNEKYDDTDQIGFSVRKRVGGGVILPEAFAALKVSTFLGFC
jgi:HK97 family phage major capsid protein